MKNLVIALLAIMLVTGAVYASDKPALEKPVLPVDMRIDIIENEPNDDCTMADYLTVDDNYSCAINPAGDEDWFEVFYPAGGEVTFETHPGDIGDTKMYLYADDCTTELDYADDGGVGYYSLITYQLAPNTTYYVRITGYTSSYTGTYFLTATLTPPPEPGETCETAVAADEYLNTAPGTGLWYTFTAPFDGVIILDSCIPGQTSDTIVRVVDACGGSIIGYSDDMGSTACSETGLASHAEVVVVAGQVLYIEWYLYTGSEDFDWNLFVSNGTVATQSTSWDGLKSLYR